MIIGFKHRLEIISRSRRASATLMIVDLDDTNADLTSIADEAAATAYSTLSAPEKHAELANALVRAVEGVERVPGQPAHYSVEMEDGRLVKATRTIAAA